MEELNDKNEFDNSSFDEDAPTPTVSDMPGDDSLISPASSGQKFDWKNAPDISKAPPRIDMDGKEVTILKAEINLPSVNKPWDVARNGKTQYKQCSFVLFYDYKGQQEFYSGVRVFKQEDGKYGLPSIMKDRKNQASILLGKVADYLKKDITTVSLKEFMEFLNGKHKCIIKTEDVKNPITNEYVKKNFVGEFIQ